MPENNRVDEFLVGALLFSQIRALNMWKRSGDSAENILSVMSSNTTGVAVDHLLEG